MNLSLLLEDFLGLMREEGELDEYLPLLLSGMGHHIVFRAQKGVRQYGVDIVSVGPDEDGVRTLFLWLVKCGDIGRSDWDSGVQAIRQSINDVGDVYLLSHVQPQFLRIPRKLLIVTNGDFQPVIMQTLQHYLSTWGKQNKVACELVNGSKLSQWTERYLLDEYVLPAESRVLFRRMLANVPSPEVSIRTGETLIRSLVAQAKASARSRNQLKKQQLTGLRAIRTALSVLFKWAEIENNLKAPYRLSEFALLCVWSEFQGELGSGNVVVTAEFAELTHQMLAVGAAYHRKLEPYYLTYNAIASISSDSLLTTDHAFKELGRLALHGCIWAFYATAHGNEVATEFALTYGSWVAKLLITHSCTRSPCYDHQAVDIHLTMLCLLATNQAQAARNWLFHLIQRLEYVSVKKKYWPLNATFQDALTARHDSGEPDSELLSTTTIIPILALWAAALEQKEGYDFLRTVIVPRIPETTLNVWSSDIGFDFSVASPETLYAHGVGEQITQLPRDPENYLEMLLSPLPGVESIEDASWFKARVPYIPLLAALHWRLQIPREMLARQVMVLADPRSWSRRKPQSPDRVAKARIP